MKDHYMTEIITRLETCGDVDLLDFILKLLISEGRN